MLFSLGSYFAVLLYVMGVHFMSSISRPDPIRESSLTIGYGGGQILRLLLCFCAKCVTSGITDNSSKIPMPDRYGSQSRLGDLLNECDESLLFLDIDQDRLQGIEAADHHE